MIIDLIMSFCPPPQEVIEYNVIQQGSRLALVAERFAHGSNSHLLCRFVALALQGIPSVQCKTKLERFGQAWQTIFSLAL